MVVPSGHPASLYGVGFHELHPGGGVEEQIPDDDGGAVGTAGFFLLLNDPGLQVKTCARKAAGGLGQQVNAADGGNGCQCLSPESHGGDGCQVLLCAEFGSGMALEGRHRILRLHSTAVVRHPQEGHAAVPDLQGDLGGSGIHGIFQQLLDHGGGALHHLSGGDQIGHMGG